MHLALIGATGFVGSAVLEEARSRGHQITAIARRAGARNFGDGVVPVDVDIADTTALAQALSHADAVISSYVVREGDDPSSATLRGYASILDAVARAGVPRLLVVGGAGSLKVPSGERLYEQPGFPAEYHGEAVTFGRVFDTLLGETRFQWSYLSPAAEIAPGERTGAFRLGGDQLLVDEHGRSRISVQDYAVAMIDELERPAHTGRRFTVAY